MDCVKKRGWRDRQMVRSEHTREVVRNEFPEDLKALLLKTVEQVRVLQIELSTVRAAAVTAAASAVSASSSANEAARHSADKPH
jgi:hypothetical protein